MPASIQTLKSPTFLIKIVELTLGVLCTLLSSVHPSGTFMAEYFYKMELVHGTFVGFCLVSCVIILTYITGTPLKGPVLMVIGIAGALMYLTSGIFAIQAYVQYAEKIGGTGNLVGAGGLAVLTAIIYAVDIMLVFRSPDGLAL